MTLNVQRQPTLLRLSQHHLDNPIRQPVILAPFSMRAILLPNQPLNVLSTMNLSEATKNSEEINTPIIKHWNDWQKIYKVFF